MKEQYLTQEGLNELRERLQNLKTVRRKEVAEAIHSAKEQGDLSENAEYASAKEEQNRIEKEIAELESLIKHAQVIQKTNGDSVDIGATVVLDCDGTEQTYRIVGSNEADPLEGRISNESPIGQAVLGKKKGEKVVIPAPGGERDCLIKAIQ